MALPPPAVRPAPRTAAVQSGTAVPRRVRRAQGWQARAQMLVQEVGVAHFATSLIADTAARCPLLVEEHDDDGVGWHITERPDVQKALYAYRGRYRDQSENVRAQAWHYQVAGEGVIAVTDPPEDQDRPGPNFDIYGVSAVEWRIGDGAVILRDAPGAATTAGGDGIQVVPIEQVTRFWMPDEDWPLQATAPMRAALSDLTRYRTLIRHAQRQAQSALSMNGILWTPAEAHQEMPLEMTAPAQPNGPASSKLQRDYLEVAARAIENDEDIFAVAPFMLWWRHEYGPPQTVDVSHMLDPNGIAYRKEALEDFARSYNLPSALIVGDPGGANHWSEWLVDERFFTNALAPLLERICWNDLTVAVLHPLLNALGMGDDEARRFRVGFDSSPVIVRPDRSDLARNYYLSGLLRPESTREAGGWTEDDAPTEADREELLQVLQPPEQLDETRLYGPANVNKTPPATSPSSPPRPATRSAAAATRSDDRGQRLAERIAQARRDLLLDLHASAETALLAALRHAGVKAATRARRRSAAVRAAVKAARGDGRLGPDLLAAVGLTEAEALDEAFTTYGERAARRLERYQRELARTIAAETGADADDIEAQLRDDERNAAAILVLTGTLGLLARRALADGPEALATGRGEQVAMTLPVGPIRDALAVSEGTATPTAPTMEGATPAADAVAVTAEPGAQPSWADAITTTSDLTVAGQTWQWGFYGEPITPFDPHYDLDGETFTSPDDPGLANPGEWPPTPYLYPGDHEFCTCAWVPSIEIDNEDQDTAPFDNEAGPAE